MVVLMTMNKCTHFRNAKLSFSCLILQIPHRFFDNPWHSSQPSKDSRNVHFLEDLFYISSYLCHIWTSWNLKINQNKIWDKEYRISGDWNLFQKGFNANFSLISTHFLLPHFLFLSKQAQTLAIKFITCIKAIWSPITHSRCVQTFPVGHTSELSRKTRSCNKPSSHHSNIYNKIQCTVLIITFELSRNTQSWQSCTEFDLLDKFNLFTKWHLHCIE